MRSLRAAVLLLSSSCLAQTFTSRITGAVTDPSGAVMPKVTVTATHNGTNAKKSAVSDTSGNYNIPLLLPGVYEVRAEAGGFQTQLRKDVRLETNQTATLDFALTVATAAAEVTVEAGLPLLQTETSGVGTTLETKLIERFPLPQRDVMGLVRSLPGIIAGSQVGDARGGRNVFNSNFSAGGGRTSTNEVLLDGAPNTVGDFNGVAIVPPQDSVQELRIETSSYSAEFGRTGGGTVNIVTKGGTNEYHGNAFYYGQNDAFNANSYVNNRNAVFTADQKAVPKPIVRRHQYGYTFGGPVRLPKLYDGKNKTFFFTAYEGRRDSDPTQGFNSVPTAKERQGDFSDTVFVRPGAATGDRDRHLRSRHQPRRQRRPHARRLPGQRDPRRPSEPDRAQCARAAASAESARRSHHPAPQSSSSTARTPTRATCFPPASTTSSTSATASSCGRTGRRICRAFRTPPSACRIRATFSTPFATSVSMTPGSFRLASPTCCGCAIPGQSAAAWAISLRPHVARLARLLPRRRQHPDSAQLQLRLCRRRRPRLQLSAARHAGASESGGLEPWQAQYPLRRRVPRLQVLSVPGVQPDRLLQLRFQLHAAGSSGRRAARPRPGARLHAAGRRQLWLREGRTPHRVEPLPRLLRPGRLAPDEQAHLEPRPALGHRERRGRIARPFELLRPHRQPWLAGRLQGCHVFHRPRQAALAARPQLRQLPAARRLRLSPH